MNTKNTLARTTSGGSASNSVAGFKKSMPGSLVIILGSIMTNNLENLGKLVEQKNISKEEDATVTYMCIIGVFQVFSALKEEKTYFNKEYSYGTEGEWEYDMRTLKSAVASLEEIAQKYQNWQQFPLPIPPGFNGTPESFLNEVISEIVNWLSEAACGLILSSTRHQMNLKDFAEIFQTTVSLFSNTGTVSHTVAKGGLRVIDDLMAITFSKEYSRIFWSRKSAANWFIQKMYTTNLLLSEKLRKKFLARQTVWFLLEEYHRMCAVRPDKKENLLKVNKLYLEILKNKKNILQIETILKS